MHSDEPDLPLGRVMTPVSPAPWPCTISSPSLSCLPFPLRFLFPFHFHLLTCPYHPPPSNLSYPSSTSPPHLSLLASLPSLLPPSAQPPPTPTPISRCLARSAPKSPSGEKNIRASRSDYILCARSRTWVRDWHRPPMRDLARDRVRDH